MSDDNNHVVLDDQGVKQFAKEIFKLIQEDFVSKDNLNEKIKDLQDQISNILS